MTTATIQRTVTISKDAGGSVEPHKPEVQPLAPVKPGDTLTGATTIDQMIAALYQVNTFGTPVSYVWIEPTCLAITYSHQSIIYIRFQAKAQPGQTTYKIGLS